MDKGKIIISALVAGLIGTLVVEVFPASIEGFWSGGVSLQDFLMQWVRWSIFSGAILFASQWSNNK